MRLFTGISLPAEVTDSLSQFFDRLKPRAKLQWTPPSNFHITTKFIGQWPEDRLGAITEALKTVATPVSIDISIEQIGFFPNIRSARVLWAGVHAPQSLAQLAHATDQALHRLKIPVETHPYSPHVTLARIKADASLTAIRDILTENISREFGSFTADAFHLYLSRPASGGSVYEILATFPFQ